MSQQQECQPTARVNAVAMSPLFVTLTVLFCVCLIVSNLMEIKTIQLGPLELTAGFIVFPISYIINDCMVEIYGFRKARLVIWLGFAANLLVVLLYFYGGTIMEGFGPFKFDSSELPIITLYAIYIPIYIALLKRKDLSGFRGKVMPVLAILCSLFMVFAAIYSHKMNVVYYLIVFVVIEIIGSFFRGGKKA